MPDNTFLSYVLEQLKKRIARINLMIAEGQKEIEDMHEYYWENYTEMDQYGYENFDNQQALLHQINANQEQLNLKHRLKKMLDSPYFGRVDFQFDGESLPETFYIGIGNFSEEAGNTPLIYDWRAPISGLFYDYDKGPASYCAPAGKISGQITAKWQYKIRNGKMLYAFENDIKIDDEILKEELGKNGDIRLKNIIRTIQREQNAIIRNTRDRILVIQGAAGSGKTSIALHRIAYLLYHDRENLRSSNVLVLSPNSVFADYISHILPELGEENIREMSFDLFAYHELKDIAADCEDKYDQIERQLRDPEAASTCLYKQSLEFLNHLERYCAELEDELMYFSDVEYRGFSMKEMKIIDFFYFRFPDIPLLSRMEAVAEYFIDELETLCGRDLAEEERDSLLEKFTKMYETRDLYSLYNRLLEREGLSPLPKTPPEQRHLRYEDIYPLLYLKYRLFRSGEHTDIKHLIVDEMQDYSQLQYRILQKLFPCKMTILGDRAQTMDENTHDVLDFLPGIFGKKIRRIILNKSYRNTVEIAEYACSLNPVPDIELFERHGKPVTEERFPQLGDAVSRCLASLNLGEDGFETAAIILLSEGETALAFSLAREQFGKTGLDPEKYLFSMDRNSSAFHRGLTVTAFYLAKGLEFDQVFGIFPEKEKSALAGQAKYITATRALHELYMFEYES